MQRTYSQVYIYKTYEYNLQNIRVKQSLNDSKLRRERINHGSDHDQSHQTWMKDPNLAQQYYMAVNDPIINKYMQKKWTQSSHKIIKNPQYDSNIDQEKVPLKSQQKIPSNYYGSQLPKDVQASRSQKLKDKLMEAPKQGYLSVSVSGMNQGDKKYVKEELYSWSHHQEIAVDSKQDTHQNISRLSVKNGILVQLKKVGGLQVTVEPGLTTIMKDQNKTQHFHFDRNNNCTSLLDPQKNQVKERVNSITNKKEYQYYVTDVVTAFNNEHTQNYQDQFFRDHFLKTYNEINQCKFNLPISLVDIEKKKVSLLDRKNISKYNKTIIFDLDETLIHAQEILNQHLPFDFTLPIQMKDGSSLMTGVNIRPFARQMLFELSQLCEIILFTASQQTYASKIVEYLDPSGKIFSHKVYRNSCFITEKGNIIKDLRVFPRELSNVVLIDNTSYAFGQQLSNGIPIIPFYQDKKDNQLLKLLEFLKIIILPADDVRPLIRQHFKLENCLKFRNAIETSRCLQQEPK